MVRLSPLMYAALELARNATAMIVVAIFSLANRKAGLVAPVVGPNRSAEAAGLASTFVFGIYSGFFSGGCGALSEGSFQEPGSWIPASRALWIRHRECHRYECS
jgi:hypothetical protein